MTDHGQNVEKNESWEKFRDAMRKIVRVPYAEVKAKLKAEDKVRKRKRSRKSKVRAFREANGAGQSGRS